MSDSFTRSDLCRLILLKLQNANMRVTKGDFCSAVNCCNNRGRNPNLSFFRFPKDKERSRRWVINTRRDDLMKKETLYLYNNCCLCSEHFEEAMFMNSDKKKLVWNAVPTIFAIPNPPKKETVKRPLRERNENCIRKKRRISENSVSCDISKENISDTPNISSGPTVMECSDVSGRDGDSENISASPSPVPPIKKTNMNRKFDQMKQTIKNLRSRLSRCQTRIKQLKALAAKQEKPAKESEPLSPLCAEFIKAQTLMSKRHPKGRRWSHQSKMLALSLYYRSPKVYRFLAKIFALPSKSTLARWAGFSEDIFKILKNKASTMSEKQRLCTLCVDELSLKAGLQYNSNLDVIKGFEDFGTSRTENIANNALVFMIRGITSNFKQPIAYLISHNAIKVEVLKTNLYECLDKLKETGFLVQSVVTDQGSNFLQLTRHLNITAEKPYFEYSGCRYFYIFDVPHLLKNTRNNLYKHNICFEGKTAKWSHLESLYEHDAQRQFRLAPKLSSRHIELPAFTKMKVKLATQVLSSSVATALETEVTFGKLPSEASHTAEFAEKVDTLFDICNSSNVKCTKRTRRALSRNSANLKKLEDLLSWIKGLQVINRKTGKADIKVNFIEGWQISGRAILELYQHLNKQYELKFLFTRRLNQDALENFFGAIRLSCGNNDNPTVLQFEQSFKHILLTQIMIPVNGGNCAFDSDTFLCDVISLSEKQENITVTDIPTSAPDQRIVPICSTGTESAILLDLPEENSFVYVCGYLLRKVFEHHPCEPCKQALCEHELQKDTQLLTHFKAYHTNENSFGSLYVSVEEFSNYIKVCESEFVMLMRKAAHMANIKTIIVNVLKGVPVPPCITCHRFPWGFLLEFYVKLRLYFVTKFTNRELVNYKRKQRKLLKVVHL